MQQQLLHYGRRRYITGRLIQEGTDDRTLDERDRQLLMAHQALELLHPLDCDHRRQMPVLDERKLVAQWTSEGLFVVRQSAGP